MKALVSLLAAVLLAHGAGARAATTTNGDVALANLDLLIAQHDEPAGAEDLLLTRSRFFADYDALRRAARLADEPAADATALVRRARVRAAVHRFSEALDDVRAAEAHGVAPADTLLLRASIASALARVQPLLPELESLARDTPSYAAFGALAAAYASVSRFQDADRAFQDALDRLDTTSPFPYAYLWFARGTMWAEQAHDPDRGESGLRRALDYLPGYVQANIHLAELEIAHGERDSAGRRLARIAGSREPELLALLARLRADAPDHAAPQVDAARARFDSLLGALPLAFADHAAEFYLAEGNDPERALVLARLNVSNRDTPRARDLLERAQARVRP
jgi:tetratricopeptide (TPR) repeat protein